MTPDQLQARYAELRRALQAGQIQPQAFAQAVGQLQCRGADGRWYQINPRDGGWLAWNGSAWVPSSPPAAPPPTLPPSLAGPPAPSAVAGPPEAPAKPVPQTFGPLLWYVTKQTLKTFFRRLPLTLLTAILITTLVTAVLFYVIAFLNDGTQKFGSAWSRPLGLGMGRLWGGVNGGLFFAIGFMLLWGFLKTFFRKGPIKAVGAIFVIPGRMLWHVGQAGPRAIAPLAGGAGLSLLIGSLVTGYASLALSVGVAALFVSVGGRAMAMLIQTAWGTTYGVASRSRDGAAQAAPNPVAGYVMLVGTSLGFLLRMFMPTMAIGIGVAVALLVLAVVLAKAGGAGSKAARALVLLAAAAAMLAVLAHAGVACAHDNGVYEEGGVERWLKTKGPQAVLEASLRQSGITGPITAGFTGWFGALLNAMAVSAGAWTPPPTKTSGARSRTDQSRRQWQPHEERLRTTWSGDGLTVSGDRAIQMLKDRGFIGQDGRFTDKYRQWTDQLYDDRHTTDVQGIAWNTPEGQDSDRPSNDITIVLRDPNQPAGPPAEEVQPEQKTDAKPQEGQDQKAAAGAKDTQPAADGAKGKDDKDAKADDGAKKKRPAWSLAHKPSADARWDPKTRTWQKIADLTERKRQQEGWIDDGHGIWTKPTVKIKPLDHKALELETDATAKNRVSERWADGEDRQGSHPVISIRGHAVFSVSDYSGGMAKTVSAVDEFHYQKRRMKVLEELRAKAKEDMGKVRDALREARAKGNQGMVKYLEGQRATAMANYRKIDGATQNAAQRMSKSGDRILVRGVTATVGVTTKAATDALIYGKTANLAGRLTSNIVKHAARGHLPGQRSVFRQSGSPRTPGGATSSLKTPKVRLRSGDQLFSEPSFSSSTAVLPGASSTGSGATPGAPSGRVSGSRLPVIRDVRGDEQLGPTGYVGRAHRGKLVCEDRGMDQMGQCSSAKPNQIKINPDRIQQVAQQYNADTKEFTWLTERHEVTHLNKAMGRAPYLDQSGNPKVRLVPGEGGIRTSGGSASTLFKRKLRLQDLSSDITTEKNVQWHMRQEWGTGKYTGKVSPQNWNAWEQFSNERLQGLEAQRDYMKWLIDLEQLPDV